MNGSNFAPLFTQFFKFAVVGVINTAVDLAVLTFLIKLFPRGRRGKFYAFFKALSFVVANVNSYVLNRSWTFAAERAGKTTSVEFSQYFLASLVGMLINVGVASFVNAYLKPQNKFLEKYWPQISALFGTAVGLMWNFLAYKIFVF